MRAIPVWVLMAALAAGGCKGRHDRSEAEVMSPDDNAQAAKIATEHKAMAADEATVDREMAVGSRGGGPGAVDGLMEKGAAAPEPAKEEAAKADDARGGYGGETGPKPRAWFPETFLFEPLVVTDSDGRARVEARVPDRLTTWRVLALAHSRSGSQAGTVTEFLGTLPAYVDLVAPPFLRAGDRVELPVQVVNTTGEPLAADLKIEAAGAELRGGSGAVRVAARDSAVRRATLSPGKPGTLKLSARLGTADAVVREIEVLPTGERRTQTRSGTLAAPREVELEVPEHASLHRLRLRVFSGALALVRSELSAAPSRRGGAADDAFVLLLSGEAPALLRSLGGDPDPEALREIALRAAQRVIHRARVLDITEASLFAEAALAHPENPVLERLGERAVRELANQQSPDGTCGGQTGWPVQRLLVATAECARAAVGEQRVRIRAAGAFERHGELVKDPYTAAAILASGAPISDQLAKTLRETILAAVTEREDGSKAIAVPEGVVRADGMPPSVAEATGLAVLALAGAKDAPLPDLGATLLASYAPERGWGDGRANLVCLRAAARLFKKPIPEHVSVRLLVDGDEVASGALDRDRTREVLSLGAEPELSAGSHEVKVEAKPALPGLGFSLALASWVPWSEQTGGGVELRVSPPEDLRAGRAAEVEVTASAPSGMPLAIELALPAGVQADKASLDAMVRDGTIQSYEVGERALRLRAAALQPAQVFSARVRVIPTLAGELSSGPSRLSVGSQEVHAVPARWVIR